HFATTSHQEAVMTFSLRVPWSSTSKNPLAFMATVTPIAATRHCNSAWRTGSGPAAPAAPVRTRPRRNHARGRCGGREPFEHSLRGLGVGMRGANRNVARILTRRDQL